MKLNLRTLALASFLTGSALAAQADDFDLYLVGMDGATYTALNYSGLQSIAFSQVKEDLDGDGTKSYENYATARYADGTLVKHHLKEYAAFRFESTAVGIDAPSAEPVAADAAFVFADGSIRACEDGTLNVVALDGRQLMRQGVSVGETLNLSGLSHGIYVVKLGATSKKIQVK